MKATLEININQNSIWPDGTLGLEKALAGMPENERRAVIWEFMQNRLRELHIDVPIESVHLSLADLCQELKNDYRAAILELENQDKKIQRYEELEADRHKKLHLQGAAKVVLLLVASIIGLQGCVCQGRLMFDPIGPCSPFDEHLYSIDPKTHKIIH